MQQKHIIEISNLVHTGMLKVSLNFVKYTNVDVKMNTPCNYVILYTFYI